MVKFLLLIIFQISYADNGVLKYIFGFGMYTKHIQKKEWVQYMYFEPWNISYMKYGIDNNDTLNLKSLRSSLIIITNNDNNFFNSIKLKSPLQIVFNINPEAVFYVSYAAKTLDIDKITDNLIKTSLRIKAYSKYTENYSYIMQYSMNSEYDTITKKIGIGGIFHNFIESSQGGIYDIGLGFDMYSFPNMSNNLKFSSYMKYNYGVFYVQNALSIMGNDNSFVNLPTNHIFTGSIESGLKFFNFHAGVEMKLRHSKNGLMYTNNIKFKIVNFLITHGLITSLSVIFNNQNVFFGMNIGSV